MQAVFIEPARFRAAWEDRVSGDMRRALAWLQAGCMIAALTRKCEITRISAKNHSDTEGGLFGAVVPVT